MGRQRHTAEQIINKLREAEVLQGKGMSMEETLRQLGVSDATYHKWRKECGGLRVDQARRLKELEQENRRSAALSNPLGSFYIRQLEPDVEISGRPFTCSS